MVVSQLVLSFMIDDNLMFLINRLISIGNMDQGE